MYVRTESFTLTMSTVGKSTTWSYSTNANGLLYALKLTPSGAAPTSYTCKIYTSSTDELIAILKNPSTLGSMYFLRNAPTGSTGNALKSSDGGGVMYPVNGRLAAVVTLSSSGSGGDTLAIKSWFV